VRHHHERWDGAGYPDGLAGPEIPLGARIFAVADTLDAMTSDRPYRRALPWDDAVDEILARNGTQFDPIVVASFARREAQLRAIYRELMPAAA
jgi:HD-GYP domain-containing protein (c-di-GMP phosphodiesterase class II)